MIKQYGFSYSPSFTLWLKFQDTQNGLKAEKSLVAFAPIFEKQQPLEKINMNSVSTKRNLAYNSNINSFGLAPLLQSRTEVENIDRIFRAKHKLSDLYLFSDAYEGNFTSQNLTDYDFIHIATHGFVDQKNPDLSGLFFAPVNNDEFDNILYTGEIYNLKLNAHLLTLSACETALGKVAEGEGMLGFSRAFLYAGAKNMVLSLWKVNDASTSVFMTHFYENILQKEMDLSYALAEAKLSLIHTREYNHPYYWAPFILIGN